VCTQQTLYPPAQFRIIAARAFQKCGTFRDRQLQRLGKQSYVPFSVMGHDIATIRPSPNPEKQTKTARSELKTHGRYKTGAAAKRPLNLSIMARIYNSNTKIDAKKSKKEPSMAVSEGPAGARSRQMSAEHETWGIL
jgi:hypothetical protein